ncbi:MAG TPA: type II secretion system F family protein [Acidimicrobiales bacterium]|nr:type II secretion system F family protein [Acidimicrobiales bacterium]
MTDLLVALAVGGGMALIAIGILIKARDRDQSLADILDMPYGERDVPVTSVTETHASFIEGAISLAGKAVDRVDNRGSLAKSLELARIPLRVGEYVVVVACGGVVAGAVVRILSGQALLGLAGALLGLFAGRWYPKRRIRRRRKAFEEQLPGALSLIASSLAAGHTFLRAIQMMCEEAEAPLAEEFARVVYETRLGDGLVDALDRMADRLDIADVRWVVQAIKIQQTVGGKLADLLHTLADFIRAREEVRREIDVLTAEGRISAWVLGALPIGLLVFIQLANPGYAKPMYHGAGLIALFGTFASIIAGFLVIRKMVKIEV